MSVWEKTSSFGCSNLIKNPLSVAPPEKKGAKNNE